MRTILSFCVHFTMTKRKLSINFCTFRKFKILNDWFFLLYLRFSKWTATTPQKCKYFHVKLRYCDVVGGPFSNHSTFTNELELVFSSLINSFFEQFNYLYNQNIWNYWQTWAGWWLANCQVWLLVWDLSLFVWGLWGH